MTHNKTFICLDKFLYISFRDKMKDERFSLSPDPVVTVFFVSFYSFYSEKYLYPQRAF